MIQQLNFLTSVKFWCLVAVAIIGVLHQQGTINSEITTAIDTILLSIVGVRAFGSFTEAISIK
jgi:hypothetical protein